MSAAHTAHAAGHEDLSFERTAKIGARSSGECFVGSLNDSLCADVDPASGRHLAVHRELKCLEPVELIAGCPMGHEVGVCNEHSWRVAERSEDTHGFSRLHQQRLIVFQPAERFDNRVELFPAPGRPAGAAVDDQLAGILRHLFIEVVHQHAKSGFLVPSFARDRCAPWCADRRVHGTTPLCLRVFVSLWFEPLSHKDTKPISINQ